MPLIRLSLVSISILIATSATGQTSRPAISGQISAGATVVDAQGAPVGTVTSTGADYIGVKTDKYEVRLPKTAFALKQGSWAISSTKADLNASVEQARAKLDDVLKPGTAVAGAQGTPLGTVDAVAGDLVTLKLASGKLVRLQKSAFAPGPSGLVIGLTAQQLEAQVSAAAK